MLYSVQFEYLESRKMLDKRKSTLGKKNRLDL